MSYTNSLRSKQYVYTENESWVDMNHVFSVLQNGKTATDLLEPASGNPIIRELAFSGNGETSFFSYENLPSNRVGDEIGKAMIEVNGEQMTGKQMMEFISNALNDRGATSPTDAPNYSKIPASGDRKAVKTKNGAVNVPVPKGFPGRVILPDGSYKAATHVRLIPGGSGVKTAYPLIP